MCPGVRGRGWVRVCDEKLLNWSLGSFVSVQTEQSSDTWTGQCFAHPRVRVRIKVRIRARDKVRVRIMIMIRIRIRGGGMTN